MDQWIKFKINSLFFIIILYCVGISYAFATDRTVDLVVSYKTVHFAGQDKKAIAVNNQIPAPTLHFKEGDKVTINVYNHLDKETAIHWHGILVPWQMDGVLGINQKGIPAGGVFRYQFILKQSGTYWYHAHAGLQEQEGLYGAFLIDPPTPSSYHYNRDDVIVLSDWSNTDPEHILANLKKEGDYYSPRFPLQPSLMKFIHDYRNASLEKRQQLVDDYKMMQQMRMSIYDISDVAYDAFLLNGQNKHTPWTAKVNVGDIVRLRFIDAGGSTLFRVKIPGNSMRMVHVQGNDIKALNVNDFTIAPGETYDVLVHIKENKPTIIYAESIDTLGAAYGALITTPSSINYAAVPPFKEPAPSTMIMNDNKMNHMDHMNHTMMMQKESPIKTKYDSLTAKVKTNDPHKPIYKTIRMDLSGDMEHFIWFINGVPEQNAHPIILEPQKRYRFIFTNSSMMHHPMHIHGHWFILRKGKGIYDPLLHTIDLAPGATITADLDTDASGQWIFHCHLLYHMLAGMARTFQYSTLIELTQHKITPEYIIKNTAYHNRPIVRVDKVRPIDISLVKHPMAHPERIWFSTLLEMGADPFNNVEQLTYKGLYGPDYNKLELFTNDAEISEGTVQNADMDIFYWHLIDPFWALKGGVNYTYRPAETPYWQPGIGIEGVMPYFIDTDLRSYYYSGSAKFDVELSRATQITRNFFIELGIRSILATKTVSRAEIGSGLNQMRYILKPYYRLLPGLNLFIEYEHEEDHGAFKNEERNAGEETVQNTVTLGFSILF